MNSTRPLTLRDRIRWIKYPREYFVRNAIWRYGKGRVIIGPFAGMRILDQNPFLPYLLGTYELELHSVLERLLERNWDRIIDIGAAEGYYAIGLSMRCPDAQCIAFEI